MHRFSSCQLRSLNFRRYQRRARSRRSLRWKRQHIPLSLFRSHRSHRSRRSLQRSLLLRRSQLKSRPRRSPPFARQSLHQSTQLRSMQQQSTRRFSPRQKYLLGWTCGKYDRLKQSSSINNVIDLIAGRPVKFSNNLPTTEQSSWNAKEIFFKCLKPNSNFKPTKGTIVYFQSTNKMAWKNTLSLEEYVNVGYATLYWDHVVASCIINKLFVDPIFPSNISLAKGNCAMQVFVTNTLNKSDTSLTHRDNTNSLLVVVAGSKTVYLAPPRTDQELNLSVTVDNFLIKSDSTNYNPSKDQKRNTLLWQEIKLKPGDSLFIPKGWFHLVISAKCTVALSCRLVPN